MAKDKKAKNQEKKEVASKANELKDKGNKAYKEEKYDEAIKFFTEAIQEEEKNPALYTNRALAYLQKQEYDKALKDAEFSLLLDKQWLKGFWRKGQALEGLQRFQDALNTYQEGLKVDGSDPSLKKAVEDVKQLMQEMTLSHSLSLNSENPEKDKFGTMLDWLRAGGAKFPYLYLQYYSEDYRGVHAATRIPNNKIILEVPLSHIMTSEKAKESDIGKKIIASGVELNSTHSYLAAYLLQEKHNPDTHWRPYINCLPVKYRNMPIFFNEEELSMLKGSFTLKKIDDRKEELREEYDNICKAVPEFRRFTHDEFVWARLVVITRIFGLVIKGNKTDGLVPMADMLNHKRNRDGAETSWTFDDSRNGFTITTLRAMQRGEEVFDSYGRKCNSRFFVNYGFSIDDNEDNQAVVFVGLPESDPHYAMKIRMLGGKRQGSQKRRFQIPMDYKEKVTKEAFSFLRFVHARDSELMLLSSDEKFNLEDINPLSIRNELAVVEHLATAAKEALAEFPTTVEEDNRLLQDPSIKPFSNERNCIIMRRGEKEVLQYYIDLWEEMKKIRDMAWKDFKKYAAKCYTGKGRFDSYITAVVVPLFKADQQK